MNLVFADSDNTPESRIRVLALLRADSDSFMVWLWVPQLGECHEHPDLWLFNLDPPFGYMATNLDKLGWDLFCEGLVAFRILPPTYEVHFGRVSAPHASAKILPSKVSLLSILESAGKEQADLDTLKAVVDLAIGQGFAEQTAVTLTAFLRDTHVPDSVKPSDQPIIERSGPHEKMRLTRRISIWTPGTSESEFISFYTPLIGPIDAQHLWEINQSSIKAVGSGDFQRQVEVGTELESTVPGGSLLAGEAAYFKAEGLRLLADIERSPGKKAELHAQAIEQYELARELLIDDPRPMRGLGRILELSGEYDTALTHFQAAKGLCLTAMSVDSTIAKLDLAHEILRATRHFIHCLLDIRATNASSQWHLVRKEQELEGYLLECENLHLDYMPSFLSDPKWYYIEWFMGLVFLAKAWGALGKFPREQRSLVMALDARRRILQPIGALTAVERSNLEWWLSVAREDQKMFEPNFVHGLDKVEIALRGNDVPGLASAIESILSTFLPPWSAGHNSPINSKL